MGCQPSLKSSSNPSLTKADPATAGSALVPLIRSSTLQSSGEAALAADLIRSAQLLLFGRPALAADVMSCWPRPAGPQPTQPVLDQLWYCWVRELMWGPKPTKPLLGPLWSCWLRGLIWHASNTVLKFVVPSARPGICFQTQQDQSQPSHRWVGCGPAGFGSWFGDLLT